MALNGLVLGSAIGADSAAQICYLDDEIRFTDKDVNENEREIFDKWWEDLIKQYGQSVDYYVHGYTLSTHNAFLGEDPTEAFWDPRKIVMVINISNDSMILSKFGIQSTSDFTGLIHIKTFQGVFGLSAEPKSDDVIAMTEFGKGRPNGRGAPHYQITSRDDEDPVGALGGTQTNTLMGHYVWVVRAKRFDFSSEPNIPREPVSDQVYDNAFAGLSTVDPPKIYDYDVDEDVKNNVFDYGKAGINTGIYGN